MNKTILLVSLLLLQSCMFSMGLGYSPEYSDIIPDGHANPIAIFRISETLAENEKGNARTIIYAEHISSLISQRDNQHGGIGGINQAGIMFEFGK